MAGDAAECDHSGKASNRIGAPTKAKEEDAIAGLPKLYQRSLTIDDIARNSESRRLSCLVVYPAQNAPSQVATVRWGT